MCFLELVFFFRSVIKSKSSSKVFSLLFQQKLSNKDFFHMKVSFMQYIQFLYLHLKKS